MVIDPKVNPPEGNPIYPNMFRGKSDCDLYERTRLEGRWAARTHLAISSRARSQAASIKKELDSFKIPSQ